MQSPRPESLSWPWATAVIVVGFALILAPAIARWWRNRNGR